MLRSKALKRVRLRVDRCWSPDFGSGLSGKGDDRRFRAAREPIRELDDPDAAGSIHPGAVLKKESRTEAAVSDVIEGSPDEGQTDLPAVGVAAKDEIEEGEAIACGQVSGVIGVVGQEECGARAISSQRRNERNSRQVIIGTDEEERAGAPRDLDLFVEEAAGTGCCPARCTHLGVDPPIVITEYPEYAIPGWLVGDHPREGPKYRLCALLVRVEAGKLG